MVELVAGLEPDDEFDPLDEFDDDDDDELEPLELELEPEPELEDELDELLLDEDPLELCWPLPEEADPLA